MEDSQQTPRLSAPCAPPAAIRSPREGGIALFIVLVLVLVLTIVIFQLTFTTKIEERVARNRQGFLEMSYALQAMARSALQQLETDLMEDLGLIDDETEEDEDSTQTPAGQGNQNPGNGQGPGGANGGAEETERFDLRHEEWAHVINENLNGVSAVVRLIDGEGRIDLNFLFEYPQYPEEESDDETTPPDSADQNPTDEDLEEEEEEWVPPTSEQIEDAEQIISRLIQAIIASNEEAGFVYAEIPDTDAAASEIVNWVRQRVEEESTRLIRSIEPLLRLEAVTHELFFGPKPEEEEDEEGFDEDDLFTQMTEELGEMPGFEQFDEGVEEVPRPLGLRDVLTAHSIGKLNLNTARPEVYIALMLAFDDFDEATEIAQLIDEYLNSYEVADEDEAETAGTPAATDAEEEDTQRFNQFSTFDDLGKVDETWSEGDATDETILDLLRTNLGPLGVFHSTFFSVYVDGELDGRKMRGVMEAARVEMDIIVLSWEESDR